MKYCFIYNPYSGHNRRNPRLLTRARDFIRQHQLDASLVPTERPLHATEIARQAVAKGCDVVVAIGGDGTMNEVATALVNTPATLGLIPCGSGNGLGRHLGIPKPNDHAFATLLHGQPRLIDTGIANGRPFFNVMGLGFDAEISERFHKLSRRGFSAYLRTTLSTWRRYQPAPVSIHGAGRTVQVTPLILSIANSDQFGNNCYIAPGAKIDDGLLDLTALKPVNLLQALPLAARLFLGRIEGSPHAVRLRDADFMIDRPGPGLIHVDGEPFTTEAGVAVKVIPRSLRVLVPTS